MYVSVSISLFMCLSVFQWVVVFGDGGGGLFLVLLLCLNLSCYHELHVLLMLFPADLLSSISPTPIVCFLVLFLMNIDMARSVSDTCAQLCTCMQLHT